MKLLFPIFASLMLQTQVNTELFALKKCLKGFGKCKNHCAVSEKEIMMCKKKKCCIEPKAAQVIKDFIQSEMLHTSKKDSQALKKFKSSNVKIPTEYHISSILPQIVSISPSANTSTIVITNATTLNSITTSTATSTKSDTTKSSDSAVASTPAPPP